MYVEYNTRWLNIIKSMYCIFILDFPSMVFKVTVIKREANKLILNWTPGHDGFSPLKFCNITVNNDFKFIGFTFY